MGYNGVVVSGLPLTGKSTLARELAKNLDWGFHSIGGLFKEQWKQQYPNQEISFEDYWSNIPLEQNRAIDAETRKLFEKGRFVGDFRYAIKCNDLNFLSVFVTADINLRIQRATQSKRYLGKDTEEIIELLNKREKQELLVGKQLYGEEYDFRDLRNYNMVIDLSKSSKEEAVKSIIDNIKKRKIYFACSIAGGRDHAHLYPEIIDYLRKHGEVLTEIFSHEKIREIDSVVSEEEIFNRDLMWLNDADVVVAETSTPSLGVGFEIATAHSKGKKILCLFKNQEKRE